ncbi:MAG: glycosyltransferase [Scytolyngbya sp. HA4215-MV1]|jgi:glycosyltransferase involved in cell wall biosynthesis|nr:glycosyltransferase [Scytolyngbya sp. HA4215-MV1]
MKTVILVDGLWEGHHSTHLKAIAKTLLALNCQILVCCPKPNELSNWLSSHAENQENILGSVEFHEPEKSSFPFRKIRQSLNAVNLWKTTTLVVQEILEKLGKTPDLLFFPWLDSYLEGCLTHHIVDQIFPYPWSGVYHQAHHIRAKSKLSFIYYGPLDPQAILWSSHCPVVSVIDRGIAGKLRDRLNSKPVVAFPDIADTSLPDTNFPLLNKIKQQAKGRRIVGLLGSQAKRKGLLTLLRAAQLMSHSGYFFVFAGVFAKDSFSIEELSEIEKVIESNPEHCFFYFEEIPGEAQFNALVDLCSLLFVVYENYPFISNILMKAAVFEKGVIASETFYIGEITQKFNLGLTVPERNVEKCVEALKDWDQVSNSTIEQYKQGCKAYRDWNSEERLHTTLEEVLSYV